MLETAPRGRVTHTTAVLGGLSAHGKDSCCSSFGQTAARESGPTPQKFTENSLPWEGTPQSHSGRTPLPEQQKKTFKHFQFSNTINPLIITK
uniref:Uncharacterized protein n=1 Tax=Geospiza parvula TaxID=87175 RepID=A0A8U8B9F6_GEOPR